MCVFYKHSNEFKGPVNGSMSHKIFLYKRCAAHISIPGNGSTLQDDTFEMIPCYSLELLGVPTVGSRETRNSVQCPDPRSWSVGFDARQ